MLQPEEKRSVVFYVRTKASIKAWFEGKRLKGKWKSAADLFEAIIKQQMKNEKKRGKDAGKQK